MIDGRDAGTDDEYHGSVGVPGSMGIGSTTPMSRTITTDGTETAARV